MPKPNLLDLKSLAAETACKSGFKICSLELETHLIPMTMQVQIRHMGGEDVSLDDCSSFSSTMSEALNASSMLNDNYILEISSPGIGDYLIEDRDFSTFKGFPIKVTYKDKKGETILLEGLLQKRSQDYVHINIKGKISLIPRKEVLEVRLTKPTS